MFSYSVCGLGIRSVVPLPELVETKIQADVVIRWGKVDAQPEARRDNESGFFANREAVCLFWKDIGAFLIRGGSEIIVDPAPKVGQQVLRLFLLGRVLGTLLHQRGLLVLHASAVSANGSAIAFMGGKGWGKSTLAGAMYEVGHSIVADDVVAIRVDSFGTARVFPGFPTLKLWPEAAAFLGYSVEALPRLHPDYEKRARAARRGFSPAPLPLNAIYVLDEGDQLEVTTLGPKEAFLELVRHSYAAKLLEATGTASQHFRRCDELVRSVSIRRLKRTSSLQELPDVTRFLMEENKNQTDIKTHATV
jgi:hypothetical protein